MATYAEIHYSDVKAPRNGKIPSSLWWLLPFKNSQMRLFLPTGLSCSDSYINLCWQALLFACKISLVSAEFFQTLKWLLSNGDTLHAKQNNLVPYNYLCVVSACSEITKWADTEWCLSICLLWLILQNKCECRKGHSFLLHFSALITTLSVQWAIQQRSSNICLDYLSVAVRTRFQNCRWSQHAPSYTHAHEHTVPSPHLISPINFTSFLLMSLSCPLCASSSPHAMGILLGLGKRRLCRSPPRCHRTRSLKLGHTSSATLAESRFTSPRAISKTL